MLRIGILDFHKLKVSDFATPEEALDVAKDYVKVQREALPNIKISTQPSTCLMRKLLSTGTSKSKAA